MIQICLIWQEMKKKNRRQMAVFGDSVAVFRVEAFNYKNLQNKIIGRILEIVNPALEMSIQYIN